MGIIIENQHLPKQFPRVMLALPQSQSLTEAERAHLGFDHTAIGERIAKQWGVPESVAAAIRFHHGTTTACPEPYLHVVRCVELANLLCTVKGISSVGAKLVALSRSTLAALSIGSDDLLVLADASAKNADAAVRLRGRILLAEDSPDNQRLVTLILRNAGAEVTVAENGQVALQKVQAIGRGWTRRWDDLKGPFDLILMDVDMPVMNGYEAARRIREAGYQGPILALTAHAMGQHVQESLAAGCNGHIAKPIDRQQLLQTLGWLFARNAHT